jgi:hypothetical protein
MEKGKLNIAMIGNGFIVKAHFNVFRQVTNFFDVPYQLNLKSGAWTHSGIDDSRHT